MPSVPTVMTSHGPVRGIVKDGVLRYLGIPYAAPPVGGWLFQYKKKPDVATPGEIMPLCEVKTAIHNSR